MGLPTRTYIPPDESKRRKQTASTGATAITYFNRHKLREPLEKPAAKKYFAACEKRDAARRAKTMKNAAAALARYKLKKREEEAKKGK